MLFLNIRNHAAFHTSIGRANRSGTVIGISSVNPRYFTINGRIQLLTSSCEHYGALINRAFDFRGYFRELEKNGFNQTWLFAGSYFERSSDFRFNSNPLAPAPEQLVPLFAGPDKERLHPETAGRRRWRSGENTFSRMRRRRRGKGLPFRCPPERIRCAGTTR